MIYLANDRVFGYVGLLRGGGKAEARSGLTAVYCVAALCYVALVMSSPSKCKLCGQSLYGPALELDELPVCNRFSKERTASEQFKLAMTMCPGCRLVQLSAYPPLDAIVPQIS